MIIHRILNNNAVMCFNENNEEVIIKGKGVAYRKKAGDELDKEKIEKVFVCDSKETTTRYQEILACIPVDCIEFSEEAIEIIKNKIDKKLSDKIYVTLTDHISNLLERISLGIEFNNTLFWDIKRMYPEEYKVGEEIVELLKDRFSVKVSKDEAGFIALHILNAQMNSELKEVLEITQMIDDIYNIVLNKFSFEINKDSLSYSRFVTHLRFLFQRLLEGKDIEIEKSTNLLNIMKSQYPKQYECIEEIMRYISKHDRFNISDRQDDEELYLLLHIIKLTAKSC